MSVKPVVEVAHESRRRLSILAQAPSKDVIEGLLWDRMADAGSRERLQ
jgi:hypothetical protein